MLSSANNLLNPSGILVNPWTVGTSVTNLGGGSVVQPPSATDPTIWSINWFERQHPARLSITHKLDCSDFCADLDIGRGRRGMGGDAGGGAKLVGACRIFRRSSRHCGRTEAPSHHRLQRQHPQRRPRVDGDRDLARPRLQPRLEFFPIVELQTGAFDRSPTLRRKVRRGRNWGGVGCWDGAGRDRISIRKNVCLPERRLTYARRPCLNGLAIR